jgi:type IV pilus assembly protein PilN
LRIEINLNQEKTRRRQLGLKLRDLNPARYIKAPPILLLVAGGCVLLFMIVMHFYQNYRLDSIDEEIQVALADSASLSTTIQMLKDIRLKKEEMLQRIEVVKDIEEKRYLLPRLMDHVSKSVPEMLWLNKWTPVVADSTNEWLQIEGESFSNIRIAEFMITLERSSLVEDVILVNIREKIEENVSTMVFTLRCRLVNGKKT